MYGLALFWFGKDARDESANNRANNSDQGRCEETHVLGAWRQGPGDEADDETYDDGPDYVKHMFLSNSGLRGELPNSK